MITYLVNSSILPGVAEAKAQAGDLASDAIPSEDPLRVVTCLTAVHSEGPLWVQAVRKRGSIDRVDLPWARAPGEFLAVWGDQVRIAAISGLTPRMAMTRLRL